METLFRPKTSTLSSVHHSSSNIGPRVGQIILLTTIIVQPYPVKDRFRPCFGLHLKCTLFKANRSKNHTACPNIGHSIGSKLHDIESKNRKKQSKEYMNNNALRCPTFNLRCYASEWSHTVEFFLSTCCKHV